MFTDMVGYTALGQRNESLSLTLVEEQRNVIRPILGRHNGREVKTMGDAFLVEFPNALDAVRCAYDIQRAIREFNFSLEPDRRIHLRIGVHVGEVLESQGDISGDAVNVASRLEPLADDGGVCISRQAYDHVRNKVDLPLSSLGPMTLKNVSLPVEVYKVVMPWEKSEQEQSEKLNAKRIAVLPFTSLSPDPSDEYFADGLTEELTDKICQLKGLEVIARTSAMNYKKKDKSVAEIGKELRAGTLVEGSVRKAGNRIRVTAQLVDANTEGHVWSSSYDREVDDIFTVQSDIAQRVAEAMKISLLEAEVQEIEKRPTKSLLAYENYLQALQIIQTGNPNRHIEVIRLLESAIEFDPGFTSAYASLGNLYVLISGETMSFKEAFEKATPLIARALELDDGSSDAHMANGNLSYQALLDLRGAESEFRRAISINPSNAPAHFWYGQLHRVMGDLEGAVVETRKANELDPLSHLTKNWLISILFRKGDREEAIRLAETRVDAQSADSRSSLAYFYLLSGDRKRAEEQAEASIALGPNIYSKAILSFVMSSLGRPDVARRLLTEAEQAGLKNMEILAEAYVALGDRSKAFELLEASFAETPSGLLNSYRSPGFDPVREDPRFLSLIRRMNLAMAQVQGA